MVEVEKGVLVIGLSNTVLFGGEHTSELILLNLATGQDFSLPLTPDQAEYLFEQVSLQEMLNIEDPPEEANEGKDTPDSRERLDGILKGSKDGAEKHEDAWAGTEAASQF